MEHAIFTMENIPGERKGIFFGQEEASLGDAMHQTPDKGHNPLRLS
jgi:hypothetical protein